MSPSRPPNTDDPLVLLVDDVRSWRRALTRYECPVHHRICVRWKEASTAYEALAALRSHEHPGPYALVVSDERMPWMTGTEFFQVIADEFPGLKRVLLTGFYGSEVAMNADGWYVFDKDWDGELIVKRICDLARGR